MPFNTYYTIQELLVLGSCLSSIVAGHDDGYSLRTLPSSAGAAWADGLATDGCGKTIEIHFRVRIIKG